MRPDDPAEQNELEKKELALGRARGKPWVPEDDPHARPPGPCEGASDDAEDESDEIVAEDDEGMIGHPQPDPRDGQEVS
jgi:hypothetical protein